jgi:pyrroline-5-carboxylate reductase
MNQSSPPVVAFIGGGNMARSLIGGLIGQGHPPTCLRAAEPDAARAAELRHRYGITVAEEGSAIVAGAAAIVLAVKPQQMREALAHLKLAPGTVVVSIAAGVRLASLQRWLGPGLHFVRTMPNTPALLNQGITGLFAPAGTPEPARALAESILRAAGSCVWLEREEEIDAVTALSGSGPAYFFLLTEVLRDAGTALGLAPATATQLARQTFIGAAAMAGGDSDVVELRRQVTSKGGTTEAAVASLEAAGLRQIFKDALAAAARRGQGLGDELERAG